GAVLDYEFTLASGNDLVAVTLPNGLTLNDVGFNLFTAGSSTRWTNPDTYNLLQYSGALGGSGVAGLSVLDPQSGLEYAFGSTGSFVTLTITSTVTLSAWNVAGGGSWNTAGNWSSGVPNGQSNVATLGAAATSPATVTLDGNKTIGTLQLDNANAYTVAAGSGGSLIVDSGANSAQISVLQGTHTISAPVTLTSDTIVDTTANAAGVTISGVVSGGGALTKDGPGTLVLSGQNTFTDGATIVAGTVELAANSALGTGAVTISGSSTLRAGANALSVGNAISIGNAVIATVDTAGRDLTLSGVVSSANATGSLTKSGAGTLTLSGSNTYQTGTIISGGVLAAPVIADGGAPSSIGQSSSAAANLVIDGGTLRHTGAAASSDRRFTAGTAGATIEASGSGELIMTSTEAVALTGTNAARTLTLGGTNTGANTFSAIIGDNGTGATSLTKAGPGSWRLAGANTFTGTTAVQAGSLILDNPLALQNSTLDYAATGGTVTFGPIFAATLGGLSGAKDLALENEFLDAVPLTVGTNNQSTTYNGVLSGFTTLTKVGTGILSLGGANTYSGTTTVTAGGGAIKALVTEAISPDSTITINNYAGLQLGDGVTISSSITAAAGANEFIDVPDAGAVGTLAGNINVGSGGNQLRVGTTGGTLRITGSASVANAGQFAFITRGNVEFAENASLSHAGGMGVGRANQASNVVFRDNAVATFGGDVTFGGGQPNPSIDFTLRDQAQFNVGSFNVDLNDSSAASNQVSINLDGGTFTAGSFTKFRVEASQSTTINFNGGVLRAGATNPAFLPAMPSLNAYVQQGGARIDTDFNDVTIEQPLVSDPFEFEPDGGLTKLGEGNLTLAGDSTYVGPTQVSGGTLVVSGALTGTTSLRAQQGALTLGAANRINDAANLVLSAGGVLNTGGFSETLGTLTLNGDAAIELSLGASVLRMGDSSDVVWGAGRLTISGWSGSMDGNGTDQIYFGAGPDGLTEGQLAQILFLNPGGFEPGLYNSKLLSTGELVVVPEPTSPVLLASGVGILALRRRRRVVRG
ncbi:MAG: beta strand repeat-containing protein, partial [Chthoniobacteraceae bacterium]